MTTQTLKTLTTLFFVFSFSILFTNCSNDEESNHPFPEKIFEGNVIIKNLEELEAFAVENYTQINGYVEISDYSQNNITTLESLASIEVINGQLNLQNMNQLTNLQGLHNLKSVEALQFWSLENLENIDALGNLKSIALDQENVFHYGYYKTTFYRCSKLQDLDGFSGLKIFRGHLEILGNSSLKNLNGLRNIDHLEGSMVISGNSLVENMDAFNNVNFVEFKNLFIEDNNKLNNIEGLKNLTSLNTLVIIENDALQSLDGLNNVKFINYALDISSNENLSDFCALTNTSFEYIIDQYWFLSGNKMNPSKSAINNGQCSE